MSADTPVAPAGVAHAAGAGAGGGGLGVACSRADGQEPAQAPAPAPSPGDAVVWRGWPLGDFQEFAPRPAAVPPARRWARFIVRAWGLAPLSSAVEHVVDELAANAVAACSAAPVWGAVRVWVLSDGRGVLVLAWDPSPRPPRPAEARVDAEHGRGLALVAGLSAAWGWYPTPETGGKTVWALLAPGAGATGGPGP